jgi:hypothetical protein
MCFGNRMSYSRDRLLLSRWSRADPASGDGHVDWQESGVLQVRQSEHLVCTGRCGPRDTAWNVRFNPQGSDGWREGSYTR